MESVGAKALASGEVLGQRPMSQRRDTLNVIMRDAAVADILLRPLCAKHLPPTPVEESGLVDRSRLLSIWGRGRTEQLNLGQGIRHQGNPHSGGRMPSDRARERPPLLAGAYPFAGAERQ